MHGILIKDGAVHAQPGHPPARADILIRDGVVAQIGAVQLPAEVQILNAANQIVTPALTDIHIHIYWGAMALGVKPEQVAQRSGTGTFVDAGSPEAGNVLGVREFIHRPSPFNTFAFLNISFPGIYGFSPKVMVGEAENPSLLNVDVCVEAAQAFAGLVVGIKVRAGRLAAGDNGALALDLGLEAAQQAALPLMCHVDFEPLISLTFSIDCGPAIS